MKTKLEEKIEELTKIAEEKREEKRLSKDLDSVSFWNGYIAALYSISRWVRP